MSEWPPKSCFLEGLESEPAGKSRKTSSTTARLTFLANPVDPDDPESETLRGSFSSLLSLQLTNG